MLADAGSAAGGAGLFLFLVLGGLYFIPTIVAVIRKVPNIGSVIVINLLLGWTLVGWVVALAMAASSVPPLPNQVIIQQLPYGQPFPPPASAPIPPPPAQTTPPLSGRTAPPSSAPSQPESPPQ